MGGMSLGRCQKILHSLLLLKLLFLLLYQISDKSKEARDKVASQLNCTAIIVLIRLLTFVLERNTLETL